MEGRTDARVWTTGEGRANREASGRPGSADSVIPHNPSPRGIADTTGLGVGGFKSFFEHFGTGTGWLIRIGPVISDRFSQTSAVKYRICAVHVSTVFEFVLTEIHGTYHTESRGPHYP